ncbi:hypothetical protein GCM10009690_15720 [Brevibacterium permense]|uniref:Uncharacterized protein n=1 Tax=Brevibacterium permense TaxID=234834 RepID=A0ABN2A977_9MICO
MPLLKNCSHKYCDHPVFPCQSCNTTPLACTAGQKNGRGWCCPNCRHTRKKEHTGDSVSA